MREGNVFKRVCPFVYKGEGRELHPVLTFSPVKKKKFSTSPTREKIETLLSVKYFYQIDRQKVKRKKIFDCLRQA